MKQLIKKWLGVTYLEEGRVEDCKNRLSEDELGKEVERVLHDALKGGDGHMATLIDGRLQEMLNGSRDMECVGNRGYTLIENRLDKLVGKRAKHVSKDEAKSTVESIVGAESFIDSVIERIQKKQLK